MITGGTAGRRLPGEAALAFRGVGFAAFFALGLEDFRAGFRTGFRRATFLAFAFTLRTGALRALERGFDRARFVFFEARLAMLPPAVWFDLGC